MESQAVIVVGCTELGQEMYCIYSLNDNFLYFTVQKIKIEVELYCIFAIPLSCLQLSQLIDSLTCIHCMEFMICVLPNNLLLSFCTHCSLF